MATNDPDTEAIVKVAGAILVPFVMVAIFIAMLPLHLLEALILKRMYEWFIVPFGLPVISYWHFVGITLFLGVVHLYFKETDKGQEKSINLGKYAMAIFAKIILMVLLLGFGYLVKGWM